MNKLFIIVTMNERDRSRNLRATYLGDLFFDLDKAVSVSRL